MRITLQRKHGETMPIHFNLIYLQENNYNLKTEFELYELVSQLFLTLMELYNFFIIVNLSCIYSKLLPTSANVSYMTSRFRAWALKIIIFY